jgi:hypothetical protein
MTTLLNQLSAYWFAPVSPLRLAILRIATGCFSLWYLLDRFGMLQRLSKTDPSLFEPLGLASFLSAPLSPEVFQVLLLLTIGLNIAYILGWQFRWTGPAFSIVLLFFMSYRNSWSMIYHNYNSAVLSIFILGLVASADAWSWDYWRRKFRVLAPDWRYGWPIKLICACTLAAYFLSGFAKVSGDLAWYWIEGSAMRSQIAVDALRKDMLGAGDTNTLFAWLYPHTAVFLAMGMGTLILELGAPLVLLHKRLTLIWVLLTFSMHWGIYIIMGIDFPYHTTGLVFLSFFELEKIKDWFTFGFKSPKALHSDTI